jgi:hypothetical protein
LLKRYGDYTIYIFAKEKTIVMVKEEEREEEK